ncbi:MAG: FG-GAP-like repeat-containing protein [Thermoplasmatota archaeon]
MVKRMLSLSLSQTTRRLASVSVAFVLVAVAIAAIQPSAASDPVPGGLPRLKDVTTEAGLDGYLHAGFLGTGVLGDPAPFPEIMGPGACWLDMDGDDDLDLFVPNGRYFNEAKNLEQDPHNHLYRNDGDGTFTDVSAATGIDAPVGIFQGCAAADYDNDGDPDLFVTAFGDQLLLRNDAGTFTDVTIAAGVQDRTCGSYACWGSSVNWLDADRDGHLDLYVNHFGDWDPAEPPATNGPEYAPGQRNTFFHNNGDGTFTDTTAAVGLAAEHYNTWASVAVDLDHDGWVDIYTANDGDPGDVYINDGDGTFTRQTNTGAEDLRHGMGAAAGDFDHDGQFDLAVSNFINEYNGVYTDADPGPGFDFQDIGDTTDLTDVYDWSGWAVHWFDANNDGHQDLMFVNGMTEVVIGIPVDEPLMLFAGDGAGGFTQLQDQVGSDFMAEFAGRGGAWADYDNDGDVDMVVLQAGKNPLHLFRADRTPGNFLNLDLVSNVPGVNRDAVGATVWVTGDGLPTQMEAKSAGEGFLGSNDPRLHFGLGHAETADIEVRWPDGTTQTWNDLRANSFLRLEQGVAAADVIQQEPIVTMTGPSLLDRLEPGTFSVDVAFPAGDEASVSEVLWDFGNGDAAVGNPVTYRYGDVGTQVVHVTVTDSLGRSRTMAQELFVDDELQAYVLLDKSLLLPHQQATGMVVVHYSNGDPVSGARIQMTIDRTFGDAAADDAAEALPRFVRDLLGQTGMKLGGFTNDHGRLLFEVPYTIQGPGILGSLSFNHPGHYQMVADGSIRGIDVEDGTSVYRVVIP